MSLRNFIKSLSDERWNIGFIQNDLNGILHGEQLRVKWMKHSYKDRWFADPFILEVTDKDIHVLVEEFYKPIHHGRISRLIVDKNSFELKSLDVVLELPTHLSFPAIIRKDQNVFIYPENGSSGELNLYQYKPETNECIKVETILAEAVADAVIAHINNKEMLFCTKVSNPNGNILCVYEKGSSDTFILNELYSFNENVARMAGNFFEYLGKVYRPTQECNEQYGHAVTLQEVTRQGNKFLFKEVRRMYSTHPKLTVGMHTFNIYKDIIVTDALGFDNMWIRSILKVMKFN